MSILLESADRPDMASLEIPSGFPIAGQVNWKVQQDFIVVYSNKQNYCGNLLKKKKKDGGGAVISQILN